MPAGAQMSSEQIGLRLDPARLDGAALGDAVSAATGGPTMYFEMQPFGRSLAVANLGGDLARDLCRAGEAEAVALATERLVAVLGGGARSAVEAGRLAGWWTDPHARGSYSIAAPGHAEARDRLRAPVGGRLFFAIGQTFESSLCGATSTLAFESGVRAARPA